MQPDIEAIFLDVGNTLRIVVEDPTFQENARQQLMSQWRRRSHRMSLNNWKPAGNSIEANPR